MLPCGGRRMRSAAGPSVTRANNSATDTLAVLFVGFKLLQLGVFVGWCLIQSGGSLKPYSSEPLVLLAGALLIAAGQTLNLSVFRALGKVGVFYGNRLGHHVPWRRTFPFTWFDHPQYVGTVLTIWGFFVAMRFPADDWLFVPVLETDLLRRRRLARARQSSHRRALRAREGVIPRLDEESLLDEPREHRRAQRGVEVPEPRRLRDSELQPRHLEKLRLRAAERH